jgi:hypothetical protein
VLPRERSAIVAIPLMLSPPQGPPDSLHYIIKIYCYLNNRRTPKPSVVLVTQRKTSEWYIFLPRYFEGPFRKKQKNGVAPHSYCCPVWRVLLVWRTFSGGTEAPLCCNVYDAQKFDLRSKDARLE